MSAPTLPDEEEESSFCDGIAGMGPHNFQPVIDIVAGTGIWLYCNQCGTYVRMDGTELDASSTPVATSPGSPTGPLSGGNGTSPSPTGRSTFP